MDEPEFLQWDHVIATFHPVRTDDLQPHAPPIGWRGEWVAGFDIEDGPYSGQRAFVPLPERFPWVPQCDLADISRVSSEE